MPAAEQPLLKPMSPGFDYSGLGIHFENIPNPESPQMVGAIGFEPTTSTVSRLAERTLTN